MLYTDALREVLAFLHSFDVGGLLLANRHLSRLASKNIKVDHVVRLDVQWILSGYVRFVCQESRSSKWERVDVEGVGNIECAVACAIHGCFVKRMYVDSRYGLFPNAVSP